MEPVTPVEEAKGETPIYRAAGMKAEGRDLFNIIVTLFILFTS